MTNISEDMKGLIVAVIFILFGLAMTPVIADYVYGLNTTTLELLTGGSAAATLIDFIPFIYAAGIVLGGMAIIWQVVRD